MKISILTLFPEMFQGPFDYSIIKRARDKKLAEINFVDLRGFGIGSHKAVDDTPYGGGTGMILRVDVVEKAISKTKIEFAKTKNPPAAQAELAKALPAGQKVVLLDPRGKTYNQAKAKEFSKLKHLILVCGHYEGTDERITNFVDERISIGDFVLTGGEIPAMLITDAVIRLIKDVLKDGVTDKESFSSFLEYPQYTKPRVYKDYSVPKILLLGNHKKIEEWRKKSSLVLTKKLRPDLLK